MIPLFLWRKVIFNYSLLVFSACFDLELSMFHKFHTGKQRVENLGRWGKNGWFWVPQEQSERLMRDLFRVRTGQRGVCHG